jgi:hypothetical protein
MDPNAALQALRAALGDYDLAIHKKVADVAADRALDAARALDEWLSKGGFAPDAWRSDPHAAALAKAGLDSGWDDHPEHPRTNWVEEVINGDTWQGYPQWVANALDNAQNDL